MAKGYPYKNNEEEQREENRILVNREHCILVGLGEDAKINIEKAEWGETTDSGNKTDDNNYPFYIEITTMPKDVDDADIAVRFLLEKREVEALRDKLNALLL